jgi:hypothetical protein
MDVPIIEEWDDTPERGPSIFSILLYSPGPGNYSNCFF